MFIASLLLVLLFDILLLLFNLPLHFLDHGCQLLFAFLSGFGIDIPGNAFAVGADWGVFALPEVVVDLVHAAGAGFAMLGLVGLEAALVSAGFSLLLLGHRGIGFADLAVDFHRRLLLHGIGDVGVNVQGRG